MKRRELDFHCADQVIKDVQQLRECGYQKLGNWNLTQCCEHLNATMKGGMDGFGFRLPWILRATVIQWSFSYCLKKRKLGKGFPTFKALKPKPADSDDDAMIDKFIETCNRAETFDGSMDDYALLDNLKVDDWRQFMWIHAGHHLSFLVPKDEAEGGPADQ